MVKKKGEQLNSMNSNKLPQSLSQNDEKSSEDDDEIFEEDLEFYQNTKQNLDFLVKLSDDFNEENGVRKRKRKALKEKESEAEYEKKPRTIQDEATDQHELLPIKSKKGLIQRAIAIDVTQPVQQGDNNNNKVDEPQGNDKEKESQFKPPSSLSIVELYARRQQKLKERRLAISELCNAVLEKPEENILHLKELCSFCEENDLDIRLTTRKLAMLSLLEVFKDIVPGYAIRQTTEKEKETKVSKDVRTIRDFENGLLQGYQNYLQILEKTIQGTSKRKRKLNGDMHQEEGLVLIAAQCMCDLLVTLSHFNYRNNIITVLVPKMNDTSTHDGQISSLCCKAFQTLFKQDKIGEVSLEVTKVISKYVKGQSYKVDPCVIDVFLHLRINDMDVLSLREKKETNSKPVKLKGQNKHDKLMKAKMSKKDKKRQKEMKLLEKELQATQAVEGQEKRAKLQTEILKFVFATYFRILKNRASSNILSPVLEGLAKHAHLINVDFFTDLMTALQGLITKEDLPLRDKLNCSLTAFKILSGQGEALNIDPRGFYCTLYTGILQLNADKTNCDVDVALKCLDVMMKKRSKQIPTQRITAFTKRLSSISLHVMPNSALALLAFVRTFFQLHTKCQKLLDNETMGTGSFRPDVNDPELSNTNSTTAWELSYLTSLHYHPIVRRYAGIIVTGSSNSASSLIRMQPEELLNTFDSSEMKFNPDISELEKPYFKSSKKVKNQSYNFTVDLWKDSSIETSVKDAVEFTEQMSPNFNLPKTMKR